MEECKCDFCDSNRAQPREFYLSFGMQYFFACTDCWYDYLNDNAD